MSGLSASSESWDIGFEKHIQSNNLLTLYWLVEGDASLASASARLDGLDGMFLLHTVPAKVDWTVLPAEDGFSIDMGGCERISGLRVVAIFTLFIVDQVENDREICLSATVAQEGFRGEESILACDGSAMKISRPELPFWGDGCVVAYPCRPGYVEWLGALPLVEMAPGESKELTFSLKRKVGPGYCPEQIPIYHYMQYLWFTIVWDPTIVEFESFAFSGLQECDIELTQSPGQLSLSARPRGPNCYTIGEGDFGTLRFKALAGGETALHFERFGIYGGDFEGWELEDASRIGVDGYFRIRPAVTEKTSFGALKALYE